jgi:hypothetical protein
MKCYSRQSDSTAQPTPRWSTYASMVILTGIFLSGPAHHCTLCLLHMTAGRAASTVIQIGNEWKVHTFHFNALQLLLGFYLLYLKKELKMTLS